MSGRPPGGWAGQRYHLGTNKEAFDAKIYAIHWALCALGRR